MILHFVPLLTEEALVLYVEDDTLTVNGEVFDLSLLGEGDFIDSDAIASKWFTGKVSRVAGAINVSLRLPLAHTASEAAKFPVPMHILQDGLVELPT